MHVLRRELEFSLVGELEINVRQPCNIVLLHLDVGDPENNPLLALHQVPIQIEEHEEVANEYCVGDDLGASDSPLGLILLVNLQTRYLRLPVDLAAFRFDDYVGIACIRQMLFVGVLQAQLIELQGLLRAYREQVLLHELENAGSNDSLHVAEELPSFYVDDQSISLSHPDLHIA